MLQHPQENSKAILLKKNNRKPSVCKSHRNLAEQSRAYPNQKWKHKLLCRRWHVTITIHQCPMLSDINFSQSHIATTSFRHSCQYPGHLCGSSASRGSHPNPSRWSCRNPEPWHSLFIRGIGGSYPWWWNGWPSWRVARLAIKMGPSIFKKLLM